MGAFENREQTPGTTAGEPGAMSHTDTTARSSAQRSARPGATRRASASPRRRMRLRRTAVVALALLMVGTVVARFLEDPADVTAASAGEQVTGAAAAGSAPSGTTAGDTTRQGAGPAPVATGPTATPTAAGSPAKTSAPAHADEDGSTTPAPNSARVTVPQSGKGSITALAIPAGAQKATGRTVRYSVEAEDGLPVSSAEFAKTVQAVLTDRRGWQTQDDVRFVPVSPQQLAAGAGVDVRVTLASPSLTARLCAPLNVTAQQVSCWNGSRSVLNLTRWMLGSTTYGTDLTSYRVYLVSHEVGHGLGHGHVGCPGTGRPAPVMVQQTKSLEGCTASPWPTGS